MNTARVPQAVIAQGRKVVRRMRRHGVHDATFSASFGVDGWKLVVWQGIPPDECTCVVRNDPLTAIDTMIDCSVHGYETW